MYSKENDTDKIFKKESFCGLYCGACELYVATQNNTLEELARERNMKEEDLECYGCKGSKSSLYCTTCNIKTCAREKEIDFCYQCTYYPCDLLKEFTNGTYPHKYTALMNLESINKKGLEDWLKDQDKRWSCRECNTTFSYYAATCGKCSSKVYNCEDEYKDLTELSED